MVLRIFLAAQVVFDLGVVWWLYMENKLDKDLLAAMEHTTEWMKLQERINKVIAKAFDRLSKESQ
jgi:hypothetical protein